MKKIFFLLTFLPCLALAHGEDKPGPNGGHVRMPGAFHTELVLGKDGSAHIYLLDMEFKNPTTKDSQVSVTAFNKKKEVTFSCSEMAGNHFHCVASAPLDKKAKIVVKATREKVPGNEAVYQLPLPAFSQGSHHNHH